MRKIILVIILVLLIPALAACGSSKQDQYQGYLYFVNGPYLMLFSLRDGSRSLVTSMGNKTIHDISDFGEGRLLVAESAMVNSKEVHSISWVDVKTGQTSTLDSGVFARYFASSGLLIYDDGRRMFVVAFAGDADSKIIFTHKMNQISTVKEIPGDIVLFETSEQGLRSIHSYHLPTGAMQALDRLAGVCRLEHSVWIDGLDQLACRQDTKEEEETAYVLAKLDGEVTRRLILPEGKRFDALTYVREQDALIFRERWYGTFGGRERSSIWVHNIENGENLRLARDQGLGSSVVYTDF